MSDMTDRNIAQMVREKIDAGLLPRGPHAKRWVGYGRQRPCQACEQPIRPKQIEHELDFSGDRTIRFHAGCAAVYQAELSRLLAGSVPRGRTEMGARSDLKRYNILIAGRSELLLKTGALLRDCGANVGYAKQADDANKLAQLTLPNAIVVSVADNAFHDVFTAARVSGLPIVTFMESAQDAWQNDVFNAARLHGLVFAVPTPSAILSAVIKHALPPSEPVTR